VTGTLLKLRTIVSRCVNDRQKRAVLSKINEAKKLFASALLSYDGAKLKARLRSAGISEGDTLLVHSNFKPDSGFQGTPLDLVNALAEAVGEKGNLLMVSIPFRGAAYDYLSLNKPFNVKKTISMMGLNTEMFRRREGTLRSLHPTHPVLACGKDAERLVADHERCLYPCGHGSPFDKFRRLKGKILFFDVRFGAITFFHYVEDLLKDRLPFPVYDERLFSVTAIDSKGENRVIQTYTFNKAIRRSAKKLEAEMLRQGKILKGRVGNSRFMLVMAEDVVSCQTAMVEAGNYPYDLSGGRQERDENYE
jgi:aminoglycoside 3-N-acetyltransferase